MQPSAFTGKGMPHHFPLLSADNRDDSMDSTETLPSTLGGQSSSTTTTDAKAEPSPVTTSEASTPALPHGASGGLDYGSVSSARSSNVVTEFTKRKGWTGLIINGFRDFYFILTHDLNFKYVAPPASELLGFSIDELLGKAATDFVHAHDRALFRTEFQEAAAYKRPARFYFRCLRKDDTITMLECNTHPLESSLKGDAGPTMVFFANARPYPTKSGSLLDSFLEHKIENLRLKRKIEDLRREEADEIASEQMLSSSRKGLGSEMSLSGTSGNTRSTAESNLSRGSRGSGSTSMSPMMVGLSQLTRQNLSRVDAASGPRSDHVRDLMARLKGDAHLDEIELRTGLLLQEGERSHGLSNGGFSPSLQRGDMSVKTPLDREHHEGDKKKKVKFTEEYVCRDCGTLESPEWRKGPQGPKSLCNACGLRWAKQEKRRSSVPNTVSSA